MDMENPKTGQADRGEWKKVRYYPHKAIRALWKLGQDDPRRVTHALKVGISLTLVSLLYLLEPLFKGIGENAIWAVMTVVVVLEFTAGTLRKVFSLHTDLNISCFRSLKSCLVIYLSCVQVQHCAKD